MWIHCWPGRRRQQNGAIGRGFPRNNWPINTRQPTPFTIKTDSCVAKELGVLPPQEMARVKQTLRTLFNEILS